MVSSTRYLREALKTIDFKSLVELYRPRNHRPGKCFEVIPYSYLHPLLRLARSRHLYRCEYQTEYVLWSNVKRGIGRKGATSNQMETFEGPLRRMIDVKIVKVDPATGQQKKEGVSRVVGLAKEEKSKRLMSSPDGDIWIEEVNIVPATRPMKIDLRSRALLNVRSENGDVCGFKQLVYLILITSSRTGLPWRSQRICR